jgi:pimeloyl-ACP methyl ester carboxylesterase
MLLSAGAISAADYECEAGAYGAPDQNIVVLSQKDWIPPPGLGYLLVNGLYGSTLSPTSPITCGPGYVVLRTGNSDPVRLKKRDFTRTREEIPVAGATLVGELLEPVGPAGSSRRPLVVMVHGSETEPAIGNNRAYLLAAQGITVFTFDKRGTGQSGGFYTQNFELLADDAVAALTHAQAMTKGRVTRTGYWGQSQGGWVAPLAATRSKVDFVAVGFGLISSPIVEDREQMLLEAQVLGLDSEAKAQLRRLSDVTGAIVSSHFATGLESLEALRKELNDKEWVRSIKGEYSADMLRMSDSDLRRVGRAVFDNLEIIWDYDSTSVLSRLDIPVLWTIADEDREAPIDQTIASLAALKKQHKRIDVYRFPETDHGMYEFVERSDGTRTNTRITDGYFELIGDWIKQGASSQYGRGRSFNE